MKYLLIFLTPLFLMAQDTSSNTDREDEPQTESEATAVSESSTSSVEKEDKLKELFQGVTKERDPFSLRDPFKSPIKQKIVTKPKKAGYLNKDGVYTNLQSVEEDIKISDIRITGVIIGKERRAIANIGGKVVILKENMTIGADNAQLKAILPGGIVLVEKITNVYGQDEYLETVIPISQVGSKE